MRKLQYMQSEMSFTPNGSNVATRNKDRCSNLWAVQITGYDTAQKSLNLRRTFRTKGTPNIDPRSRCTAQKPKGHT